MHPAASVIFFTTISGAGYGLLVVAILGHLSGLYVTSQSVLLTTLMLAFVFVTAGLLSSTFHLGHPERAWRALSQWRSSWLSREGLSAIVTFIPWLIFTLTVVFNLNESLLLWSGVITVIMAMVTVYTTSMIYRSLKTIAAWYNPFVTPLYLLFALTSGIAILNLILFVVESPSERINNLTLVCFVITLLLKRAYWYSIKVGSETTLETATGLGHMGDVKSLEHPHANDNYLLKEMGYQIGRKHSHKLRNIFTIGWILALLALALTLVFTGMVSTLLASIAVLAMATSLGIERWLFFAEAKHTQALYYGH